MDFSSPQPPQPCLLEAIKLYMQEKCTLDIDDAEVYLIPQKEAGIFLRISEHRITSKTDDEFPTEHGDFP